MADLLFQYWLVSSGFLFGCVVTAKAESRHEWSTEFMLRMSVLFGWAAMPAILLDRREQSEQLPVYGDLE